MLKSDVEAFLEKWLIGDKFLFETYNWFAKDLISIKRVDEDKFECQKNSTSDMGDFTKSEMTRLISSNIFIHLPYENPNDDLHEKRSNGCICGAASTSNPDKHAFHCKKYFKS